MKIQFKEHFKLPADELYSHFETPADWAKIFWFRGDTRQLGDGWYSVPLKNIPFPIEARHTEQKREQLVRWEFGGRWRGQGEVRLEHTADGVTLEGFEEIAFRPLGFLSPFFEWLILERGFRAVWGVGWHRLHKIDASRGL